MLLLEKDIRWTAADRTEVKKLLKQNQNLINVSAAWQQSSEKLWVWREVILSHTTLCWCRDCLQWCVLQTLVNSRRINSNTQVQKYLWFKMPGVEILPTTYTTSALVPFSSCWNIFAIETSALFHDYLDVALLPHISHKLGL